MLYRDTTEIIWVTKERSPVMVLRTLCSVLPRQVSSSLHCLRFLVLTGYGFCRKQNLQCLVQSRVQCVIQSCDQLTHNNYTLKKMKALPEDSWMLARVLSQTGVQDSTSMYKNIIGKDVFSYASWSVILSLSTKYLIFTHCADEKVDDTKSCKPFGRKEN